MIIKLDEAAIRALGHSEQVRVQLEHLGSEIAQAAAEYAPKRTGAGAASITSQVGLHGPVLEDDIGWDSLHYYMRFQNEGTARGVVGQHFMERARDQYLEGSG
jgi:hypothetical protein